MTRKPKGPLKEEQLDVHPIVRQISRLRVEAIDRVIAYSGELAKLGKRPIIEQI